MLFTSYGVDECAEMGSECGKRLKEPLRAPRERIGDCALEKDVSHVAEVMRGGGLRYLFIAKREGQ